jgi:dTDP-4-dehydrorhamnose 3,5-epimerase-like enzyme
MKIIKPYKTFKDVRGELTGIINSGTWREVNYLETAKNQIRGNHYHKKTLELFYILEGKIEISIKNIKNNKTKKLTVVTGTIILIEPFELHTFLSKTKCRWINILSKKISDKKPDIHKPKEKVRHL